jgi:hypothetical protein
VKSADPFTGRRVAAIVSPFTELLVKKWQNQDAG